MRDGQAGLGHPPCKGGGGGGGVGSPAACLQGGVEGVLKGSERPEAGCLGELIAVRAACSGHHYGSTLLEKPLSDNEEV